VVHISLCVIAKDEEENIARCLDSVRGVCDEIIVVDTGSRDRTAEVAASRGARVFDHPWGDDFAAARNAGLERATGRWILVLDADEELSEGGEILRQLAQSSDVEGFFLRIRNDMGEGRPSRRPSCGSSGTGQNTASRGGCTSR